MNPKDARRFGIQRLRWNRSWRAASRGAVCGAAVAWLSFLLRRLQGHDDLRSWLWILTVTVGCGLLAWSVDAWRYRGRESRIIDAELDRRLGLFEQATTASWIQAQDAEGSGFSAAVQEGLEERLAQTSTMNLESAFPRDRGGTMLWALAAFALVSLLLPLVPAWEASKGDGARDLARDAKEAQELRSAARRLAKSASELERRAAEHRLERARAAALDAARQFQKLEVSPPPRAQALARLESLSRDLDRERERLLRGDQSSEAGERTDAFGQKSRHEDSVSALLGRLDRADPLGLEAELTEQQLALERAAARREAGENGPMDSRQLEQSLAQS
ncbi:MAG: hypothetical protein KDB53_16845, partial [Planctomycetes bacterium]|nr:hypothetical protein [Planctomycetota bacterium]